MNALTIICGIALIANIILAIKIERDIKHAEKLLAEYGKKNEIVPTLKQCESLRRVARAGFTVSEFTEGCKKMFNLSNRRD